MRAPPLRETPTTSRALLRNAGPYSYAARIINLTLKLIRHAE
jgi:hypothetical protein